MAGSSDRLITSLQNPLVKQVRKLSQAKVRHQQQTLLLEGTHLLQEALAADYPLYRVCYTPEWQAAYPTLWQRLCTASPPPQLQPVSAAVLKSMATTVQPDGVIAVAPSRQQFKVPNFDQLGQLGLLLERIQDPGNLGAMIRTTAAAGGDALWVSSDCVDLEHPKVLRASAGQWFRLPMATVSDPGQQIQQLQQQSVQIVATTPTATLTCWDLDLTRPTVFLMGNEGSGLSTTLMDLADQRVQIPLAPAVESLNVAIAAAILLYEARRQRARLPQRSTHS